MGWLETKRPPAPHSHHSLQTEAGDDEKGEDAQQRRIRERDAAERWTATLDQTDPDDTQGKPVSAKKGATSPQVSRELVCPPPDHRDGCNLPSKCPPDKCPHRQNQQRIEQREEKDVGIVGRTIWNQEL